MGNHGHPWSGATGNRRETGLNLLLPQTVSSALRLGSAPFSGAFSVVHFQNAPRTVRCQGEEGLMLPIVAPIDETEQHDECGQVLFDGVLAFPPELSCSMERT